MKSGEDGTCFTAVMEAEWNLQDVLADTIIVCRRLGRRYSTVKKALKVGQAKQWRKSVRQNQDRLEAIEHLHFVYATPDPVPSSAQRQIKNVIAGLKEGFPLPTVTIWTSSDLDKLLRTLTTVEGGDT